MIQVTDKYAINVTPECYAVAVYKYTAKQDSKKIKAGERIYENEYFYGDLEGALKKISSLIEKDGLPQFSPLISAIERVERIHLETREYIKRAVSEYEHYINH